MRKLAVTTAAFALLMGTQFVTMSAALAAPGPARDVAAAKRASQVGCQ